MTRAEAPDAINLGLAGRVVLVTGGVRGVGAGISSVFAEQGATVITCARRAVEGLPYEFHSCDVRDDDAVKALIDAIVDRHGRLDVVVNNAGGSPYVLTADSSAKFNRKIIELNLIGALSVSQHANDRMQNQQRGGSIVNICSVSGRRPTPGTAAYGAAKAGLESLTQTLAVEWGPKVRVNACVVGMVETEQSELFYGDAESIAAISTNVPLRPAGQARGYRLGRSVFGLGRGVLHQRRHVGGARRRRATALSRHHERNQVEETTDMGVVDGRVVIVTGAGGGIGREHALAFAAEGARVVVNDIGVGLDGSPAGGGSAAQSVVDEITAAGGEAVANGSNIADWDQAAGLISTAVETFGGLDVVVNNAGIVRDRMIANTSEEEFDAVIAVHLKGHFATMRHAASYWRGLSKAGKTVDARIINTSSGAGLQGSVGQGNYSAAKAGIAALTLVAAAEMGRYGVTVNAIAPSARTRMTETVFAEMMAKPDEGFDAMAPENISPLVVWLGSAESRDVTGKVFEVEGGIIRVAEGWAHGPQVDKGARWDPAELGPVVADLLAKARPPVPVYGA